MDFRKMYEFSHEKNQELIDRNRKMMFKINSLVKNIQALIKQHKNCSQYHKMGDRKATCLDVVYKELEKLKEKRK